ncbi:hypothetical protein GCM10027278_34650 [Paralcaligenes ginsengisoli]|jgi:hypothetical protein
MSVIVIMIGWVIARAAARAYAIPEDQRPAMLQGSQGAFLLLVGMLGGVTLVLWGVASFF